MAKHTTVHYENNPFYIGLKGLQLLFRNAQAVAIYAAILAGVGILFSTISSAVDTINQLNQPNQNTVMDAQITATGSVDVGILLIVLGIIFVVTIAVAIVSLFLYGVLEYTGARLALGEKVSLQQAFLAVWRNLLGYIWVYIIAVVKIFLWTLLLIVPGIIMSVRYTLAGTVFFAENKRGNAAIKRSLELTKGAWFTTFAGYGLWNLMTLGQITPLINPSANAILYRQLKDVTDSGAKKPSAHWLSWLTFFGPIALFILFVGFVLLMVLAAWLALQ